MNHRPIRPALWGLLLLTGLPAARLAALPPAPQPPQGRAILSTDDVLSRIAAELKSSPASRGDLSKAILARLLLAADARRNYLFLQAGAARNQGFIKDLASKMVLPWVAGKKTDGATALAYILLPSAGLSRLSAPARAAAFAGRATSGRADTARLVQMLAQSGKFTGGRALRGGGGARGGEAIEWVKAFLDEAASDAVEILLAKGRVPKAAPKPEVVAPVLGAPAGRPQWGRSRDYGLDQLYPHVWSVNGRRIAVEMVYDRDPDSGRLVRGIALADVTYANDVQVVQVPVGDGKTLFTLTDDRGTSRGYSIFLGAFHNNKTGLEDTGLAFTALNLDAKGKPDPSSPVQENGAPLKRYASLNDMSRWRAEQARDNGETLSLGGQTYYVAPQALGGKGGFVLFDKTTIAQLDEPRTDPRGIEPAQIVFTRERKEGRDELIDQRVLITPVASNPDTGFVLAWNKEAQQWVPEPATDADRQADAARRAPPAATAAAGASAQVPGQNQDQGGAPAKGRPGAGAKAGAVSASAAAGGWPSVIDDSVSKTLAQGMTLQYDGDVNPALERAGAPFRVYAADSSGPWLAVKGRRQGSSVLLGEGKPLPMGDQLKNAYLRASGRTLVLGGNIGLSDSSTNATYSKAVVFYIGSSWDLPYVGYLDFNPLQGRTDYDEGTDKVVVLREDAVADVVGHISESAEVGRRIAGGVQAALGKGKSFDRLYGVRKNGAWSWMFRTKENPDNMIVLGGGPAAAASSAPGVDEGGSSSGARRGAGRARHHRGKKGAKAGAQPPAQPPASGAADAKAGAKPEEKAPAAKGVAFKMDGSGTASASLTFGETMARVFPGTIKARVKEGGPELTLYRWNGNSPAGTTQAFLFGRYGQAGVYTDRIVIDQNTRFYMRWLYRNGASENYSIKGVLQVGGPGSPAGPGWVPDVAGSMLAKAGKALPGPDKLFLVWRPEEGAYYFYDMPFNKGYKADHQLTLAVKMKKL